MKKLLIIAYHFYPENTIASLRPMFIAKYLSKNHKYIIDVITSAKKNNSENDGKLNFIRKNFIYGSLKETSPTTQTSSANIKKSKNILAQKLATLKRTVINTLTQYRYYLDFKMNTEPSSLIEYDYVFSTFGPYANHWIAKYIKKKNNKVKWIADFRDPVYNPFYTPKIFKAYDKSFARKVCKNADFYTAVSCGTFKGLFLNDSVPHKIIYNGFDKEEKLYLKDKKVHSFNLTYVGSMYQGRRDLSVIFRCISELINENLIESNRITFNYAGKDFEFIMKQANRYNLTTCIKYHGFLNREDTLNLEFNSDILLLPTWNKAKYKGVIPGKLYEYLMINKYIIEIVDGDSDNNEVANIIMNTESGYTYYNDQENKYQELKMIVLRFYKLKQEGKYTIQSNNREISKYDYESIANQINDIFESL